MTSIIIRKVPVAPSHFHLYNCFTLPRLEICEGLISLSCHKTCRRHHENLISSNKTPTFEDSEVAVDSGFFRHSIVLLGSTGCGRSSDHCRGAAGSCGDSLVGPLSPHLNPRGSGSLQWLPRRGSLDPFQRFHQI